MKVTRRTARSTAPDAARSGSWPWTFTRSDEGLWSPAGCGARVRLPLFPLHTVLFPEATLALQIFEPRYREMIGRCLAHDEPFGVVLILEGEEVGGGAAPRKVGTEASIIASERSKDGQYDIVVEGRRRFRILSLDRSRSYLRADVEFLEDSLGPDAASMTEAVARLVAGVVQALEARGHVIIDETWNQLDPRSLSYHVAASLPATDDVRQELLEIFIVPPRPLAKPDLLMPTTRLEAEPGPPGPPKAKITGALPWLFRGRNQACPRPL